MMPDPSVVQDLTPCQQPGCTQWAAPEGESFTLRGTGRRPDSEQDYWFRWYRCPAGHRYMIEED